MRNFAGGPEAKSLSRGRRFEMRKYVVRSITALAVVLIFSAVTTAQDAQQSGEAKTDTKSKTFDAHDFGGVWNPAPRMQPKGEVHPLDLGGHPDPLPPFSPAGQAKYLANKKFIDAGDALDCAPFGAAKI